MELEVMEKRTDEDDSRNTSVLGGMDEVWEFAFLSLLREFSEVCDLLRGEMRSIARSWKSNRS